MVIVFTKNTSPRLKYTLRLVFQMIMGIEYEITSDPEKFQRSKFRKINYSRQEFPDLLRIYPEGLLDEQELVNHEIAIGEWKKLPTIFANNNNKEFPFDIFSAIFYLVSRFEEYLSFTPDNHNRFEANQSLAFKHDFLQLPIVELWTQQLARNLGILRSCPGLKSSNYSFLLTIDIDKAWFYKHRGILKMIPKLARNTLLFQFSELIYKLGVITGKKSDPGESYDLLMQSQEKLKSNIEYFILCNYGSRIDNNFPFRNHHFRDLVKQLDNLHPVGLHPSYASNNSFTQLKKEQQELQKTIGHAVNKSRQHYLMLNLPNTYRRLIKLGIRHDYTMGYASKTGFRAGISRPFYFYDLYEEKETELLVHPFQVMDRTLQQYLNSTHEYAIQEMKFYTSSIKSVGGTFCALWHNTSLNNKYEWSGWSKVFEAMIEMNAGK